MKRCLRLKIMVMFGAFVGRCQVFLAYPDGAIGHTRTLPYIRDESAEVRLLPYGVRLYSEESLRNGCILGET